MADFPPMSGRRSSLAFRKNELVNCENPRRLSLLETKANGEVNKNLKNLVVKVSLFTYIFQPLSTPFFVLV
jgi:hypothetical protein